MLKALVGAACAVIIITGGVAARDRYMTWSCLAQAKTFGTNIGDTAISGETYRTNKACEEGGWIEPDTWKRF